MSKYWHCHNIAEGENIVQQERHSFNPNGRGPASCPGHQSSWQEQVMGQGDPSDAQQTHQCSGETDRESVCVLCFISSTHLNSCYSCQRTANLMRDWLKTTPTLACTDSRSPAARTTRTSTLPPPHCTSATSPAGWRRRTWGRPSRISTLPSRWAIISVGCVCPCSRSRHTATSSAVCLPRLWALWARCSKLSVVNPPLALTTSRALLPAKLERKVRPAPLSWHSHVSLSLSPPSNHHHPTFYQLENILTPCIHLVTIVSQHRKLETLQNSKNCRDNLIW